MRNKDLKVIVFIYRLVLELEVQPNNIELIEIRKQLLIYLKNIIDNLNNKCYNNNVIKKKRLLHNQKNY